MDLNYGIYDFLTENGEKWEAGRATSPAVSQKQA